MSTAPPRPQTAAQNALNSAIAALVVAVACIVMFLPPFVEQTTGSVVRTVLTGLALTLALLLHWVFLGLAASRMRRSVAGWLALSVLLFPIGSAAAVILLGGFRDDTSGDAARHPAHPAP